MQHVRSRSALRLRINQDWSIFMCGIPHSAQALLYQPVVAFSALVCSSKKRVGHDIISRSGGWCVSVMERRHTYTHTHTIVSAVL